jgi:hypothetical protein
MRSRWARPTLCTSTSRPRAGYADLVAPPMFAVVYSTSAVALAVFDPDVAMNFAMEVQGAQEFRCGPLVIAGDEITTRASVKGIYERGGRGFYVFETVSVNKRGETMHRDMDRHRQERLTTTPTLRTCPAHATAIARG